MANGHIRENHQLSAGSAGNPDTGGQPPVDTVFNMMLPDIAGRSISGAALKTALAAGGLSLPWMVYVLEKQKQGTCVRSPRHPTTGEPWQHRQDVRVPPAERIRNISAVP